MRKFRLFFKYGAFVSVNQPTRVAKISTTIIDNVISTNIFDESLYCFLFQLALQKSQQHSSSLKLKSRIFNKNNLAPFRD